MGLIVRLTVIDGVLQEPPVYNDYGSNWLAIIRTEPTAPGKLGRNWCNRADGRKYHVETLKLFDPIEFGADSQPGAYGRKDKIRWYGIVVAITDEYIEFEQTQTGLKAIKRSAEVQQSGDSRLLALLAERDALLAKAAKLDDEIQELQGTRESTLWSKLGANGF